jgi:hypothetical protein
MKKREKMLAAGLVGILVLWQGSVMLNKFIFAPVAEREEDIAAREKRVSGKKRELRLSDDAADKLRNWKKRSLPPDPVVATSLYQNWLIDQTAKAKLTNPTVTPNKFMQPKGDTYSIVSATIKAQGTLERLCDFLYEFRRSGLLHRVSRMTLATDDHKGDPKLDIELTVEGLSLKDAPARSTLFSDDNLADLPTDKPLRDRKTYSQLLSKNLFVRGYNGPPRTRPIGPTTPAAPKDDPREFVFLVGSVSTGGGFDAMLYDRLSNETRHVVAGSDFSLAGVDGRVVSVGVDHITFKMKGEEWRLDLGENLAQMRKLASTPAKVETGASESPADPDAG